MKKPFLFGMVCGMGLLAACGAVGVFPYKYYSISMPNECYTQGKLLGKAGNKGWPDLPLTSCLPDAGNKLKCLTVLDGDFYSAKADFLKCQQDLHNCQKGPPPK